MSRTDIGAPSLAKWLRRVAGDGSVEWVTTPMHSNVLLDVADLLDESVKLRELAKRMHYQIKQACDVCDGYYCSNFDEDNECCVYDTLLRELGGVDA